MVKIYHVTWYHSFKDILYTGMAVGILSDSTTRGKRLKVPPSYSEIPPTQPPSWITGRRQGNVLHSGQMWWLSEWVTPNTKSYPPPLFVGDLTTYNVGADAAIDYSILSSNWSLRDSMWPYLLQCLQMLLQPWSLPLLTPRCLHVLIKHSALYLNPWWDKTFIIVNWYNITHLIQSPLTLLEWKIKKNKWG